MIRALARVRLTLSPALLAVLLAVPPAAPAAAPIASAAPAVQVDTMDLTLFVDKPTVVKLTQSPIGTIRIMPRSLTHKVTGKDVTEDYKHPDAYAFVYMPTGGKKMPGTYYTVASKTSLNDPLVDVQLVGPGKGGFSCLLPTKYDPAKGLLLNARVENTQTLKNCASTEKGFKASFEYNYQ